MEESLEEIIITIHRMYNRTRFGIVAQAVLHGLISQRITLFSWEFSEDIEEDLGEY